MDSGHVKTKMSGYLYKKCKKRMISSWKTYWFVLEDRLLLYYRSKDEYQAISPCKGSINLGPPCLVKSFPSVTNAFQIETRTNTVTLKTDTSEDQMKWMQNIMAVLHQNQNFRYETPAKLSHFRYSLDNLVPEREPSDQQILERQNTMPDRLKLTSQKNNEIIDRLQKIGAHSYGGSLGTISKIAAKSRSYATEHLYERISGHSFLVDNGNYSVPLRKTSTVVYEEPDRKLPGRDTKSLFIENEQYIASFQNEEAIYAEPKINELTDYNKNSVLIENTLYASTSQIKSNDSTENLYEDLDKYSNHYSQPIITKSENENTQNPRKKFLDILHMREDKKSTEKSLKKSRSFMGRVWKKKNKDKHSKEEEIYAEVDDLTVEKIEQNPDNAIQMLSELQNILDNKRSLLKLQHSISKEEIPLKNEETATTSANSDTLCPAIPPKTQKKCDEIKTLNEILDDLNKEKIETNKVKKLIEKFNDTDPNDVILRKHDKPYFDTITRHSDDLNQLLDQLAKITSAPIMTPGVTSSLVNHTLTDEEWLKLLPVRQRRLSEPDYDVPRPHKSIQLPTKEENSDAIPVTRFFGPALADNNSTLGISMTPDSLEIDDSHKSQTQYSYSSHNYYTSKVVNFDKQIPRQEEETIIYAMPKHCLSVATRIVNTCQNIYKTDDCTIIYKNVRNFDANEEIFADSLEICNQ